MSTGPGQIQILHQTVTSEGPGSRGHLLCGRQKGQPMVPTFVAAQTQRSEMHVPITILYKVDTGKEIHPDSLG